MDSCDLIAAADISGKIPANFYTQMESKKWSDRKEALEIIEKATSVPKIANADFAELVRILKRTVSKDSNIVVVTLAAKCMCQLAQGLGSHYSPYATSSLPILFDKFKEKKPNVIGVMRDAADAVFVATNLEDAHEDIIKFLDNKNPQNRSEMALFLTRAFAHHSSQVRNKKILKPIISALGKTLSDMDATVRDNSAMALGTAMKIIGEALMMPLIGDVEPIKVAKIKEFCEKAEIFTAPVNGHNLAPSMTNGQQSAPVTEVNGVADVEPDDEEALYDLLEATDISGKIPANFYTQMESKKWSERKEALEIIEKVTSVPKIANADFAELVRVLKKTISKDSNIVVATLASKCMFQLARGLRTNYSPYATSSLPILFEKFKEKKPNVISVNRDAADAVFVATNLEDTHEDIIKFLDHKNPQNRSEMALFLARAFSQHSSQVRNKKILKPIIGALAKTLSDMDVTVRDNSAMALGTAMKIIGEGLMMPLIGDVEPIKVAKIKEFCEKAQVKKVPQNSAPPPPVMAPPPPTVSSSATMVRPPKPGPKPVNATVKRTATIIKRSTLSKRASGLPQPPKAPANIQQPQPVAPTIVAVQQQVQAPLTPVMPTFSTQQVISKQSNFDMIVFRLISDDSDEVAESLTKLEEMLSEEELIKSRINQIIDLSCLQLIKSRSNSHALERVADYLTKLFARPQLVLSANPQTIRFLLVQLFALEQIGHEDSLSNLSSAVMDSAEPSVMMSMLTEMLNDPSPTSIINQIKKAIIRSMRSFK